ALITLSNINRRRKWIHAVPVLGQSEFIAGGAGNRALPVCVQPRDARMRQIIPATILASESFVNAKNSHLTLRFWLIHEITAGPNEKRGLRRVSEPQSWFSKIRG